MIELEPFDLISAKYTTTLYCVSVGGREHYFDTFAKAVTFRNERGGVLYIIDRTSGHWYIAE